MSLNIGGVVIITILAIIIYFAGRWVRSGRYAISRTRGVVSRVDGMPYRVHEVHAGPQEAADMLAALNGRAIGLLRALRGRYARGADGARYPERRTATQQLLERYNPDSLAENSPKDPGGDTSYTLDKGAVIAICLRDPARAAGDIHDLDMLTFVTIHEMAHIAVKDIDHPPRFWGAFRFLLEEAEGAGVYTSVDYARTPRRYCGIQIDYNPRYDLGVKAL